MVRPAEPPLGGCTLREEGPDLYVEEAHPRILIADEIVEQLRQGQHHPSVSMTDNVIRIRAKNQTVIYRLIEHRPEWQAWIAQWPD